MAWIPVAAHLVPLGNRGGFPFQTGCVMGLVFWLGTIYWIAHATLSGMLALAVPLILIHGMWAWLFARLAGRWSSGNGVWLALVGAAAWVALEWFKAWPLGGFQWNYAAVSQFKNPALIQVAAWTGVYGVSFLVLYVNLSLWLAWRRWGKYGVFHGEFFSAALLAVWCLVVGNRHLNGMQHYAGEGIDLKIALVQPNIPQEVKYQVISRKEQQERLWRLTLGTASFSPDLVIWPETALVRGPSMDPDQRARLQDLARRIQAPLFFGAVDMVDSPEKTENGARPAPLCYNAAMWMDKDGVPQPAYHKLHLVPFGEYVPGGRRLRWLRRIAPIQGRFSPGREPVLFEARGIKFGPLICFEDTIPWLSRQLCLRGADALVNLTNDAWFKESPGAAMHAANAVFRAIENRRPMIRCSNSGLTCVVDADGRVLSFHQPFVEGVLKVTPQIGRQRPVSFYATHGDWFPLLCGLVVVFGAWGFRKSPS